MALITLMKEEFQAYSDQVSSRSFYAICPDGDLLEKEGLELFTLL